MAVKGPIPDKVKNIIIAEALCHTDKGFIGERAFDAALMTLIKAYESLHNRYSKRYSRYKAETAGTPIKSRTLPNFMKINNQINNSFMSEIIDTKLGYMIGVPIVYAIRKNKLNLDEPSESEVKAEKRSFNEMYNKVIDFCTRNNVHDNNMETVKMCSICGTSSRLLYLNGAVEDSCGNVDEQETSARADIKLMNIDPWETIFIYNNSLNDLNLALRYFHTQVQNEAGLLTKKIVVQIYTKDDIYRIVEGDSMLFSEEADTTSHVFGMVPLFEYVNNRERQGDCDKILSLIDAYDKAVSDLSSELEQFRLAYIALYGLKTDKGTIDELRQTGMFEMTKDGKMEFVTKKVEIEPILKYLDRIENNIIRFAKSVNFKDENFFGNLSGVAIRYKLMQLEEKAMTAQVKFETADVYMWRLLEPLFKKELKDFDYTLIKRQFTRNIPVNMLEEARIQTELEGMVSTRTRMGIASFIENPELEEQALIAERVMLKEKGIEFNQEKSTTRVYDIEKGGITDRNTNGTVGEK